MRAAGLHHAATAIGCVCTIDDSLVVAVNLFAPDDLVRWAEIGVVFWPIMELLTAKQRAAALVVDGALYRHMRQDA